MSQYRRYDPPYDDYGGRGGGGGDGGQRWDRDRFERMSRSRGGDYSRYEEDDRSYGRGYDDRKVRVEIDDDRRGSYDNRYYEEDRYSSPRRSRPDYLDEDRFRNSGREMAPYRRDYERDYETPSRQTQRPSYNRRQSSLDTHDRRPLPRYGDQERDINVNLNLQGPTPQYREYDYSHSNNPRQEYYAEEDYRNFSIRRERERSTYRRGDDYDDRYEEEAPPRPRYQNRRGRTKMPKRLVHRSAIVQMGYPFEEEEFFYIVRTALAKDQIDEVIKISESYFREERSTSIQVDESRMIGPAPGSDHSHHSHEQENNEIIETRTTKIIENPTEEDIEKYGKAEEHSSSSNDERDEEVRSESNRATGSQTMVLPERRKESDIKAEIKQLEAERRALKYERESRDKGERSERRRDSDYEIVRVDSSDNKESERERDVVRVEKDSRGGRFLAPRSPDSKERSRSRSRRRPSQKMVNAALFSLT